MESTRFLYYIQHINRRFSTAYHPAWLRHAFAQDSQESILCWKLTTDPSCQAQSVLALTGLVIRTPHIFMIWGDVTSNSESVECFRVRIQVWFSSFMQDSLIKCEYIHPLVFTPLHWWQNVPITDCTTGLQCCFNTVHQKITENILMSFKHIFKHCMCSKLMCNNSAGLQQHALPTMNSPFVRWSLEEIWSSRAS